MPVDKEIDPVKEITLRRCAVFNALQPYLQPTALMEAMWLWEDHYATGHIHVLKQFIDEVFANSSASTMNTAYQDLVHQLMNTDKNAINDPFAMMRAWRNGKLKIEDLETSTADSSNSALVVFNSVLKQIMHDIHKQDFYFASCVREYVPQVLPSMQGDYSIAQLNEINLFLNDYDHTLKYEYNEEQMRILLHVIFIGCCEFFGQKQAETFIETSLAIAEQIAEAAQFSPRMLLE